MMIIPSYQDWLQSKHVDWQRFKYEEYYAEMFEDQYVEEQKYWRAIDES